MLKIRIQIQFFAWLHYSIYLQGDKQGLMPTFMVIFEDGTFTQWPFIATNKATFYRMAYQVVKMIKQEPVRSVFYLGEYYVLDPEMFKEIHVPYGERRDLAEYELLSFSMISKTMNRIITVDIDTREADDEDYAVSQILNLRSEGDRLMVWLMPIYEALCNS